MNRAEAEKIARRITLEVCTRKRDQDEFLTSMLKQSGYRIERVRHDYMDGFELHGPNFSVFIEAPRKSGAGTARDLDELEVYEQANAAIMAGDYARASKLCDELESASLKNEILQGLDSLYNEMGYERISGQFETGNGVDGDEAGGLDELEQVHALLGYDEGVTVTQKRAGCCIWVSGDTKKHKETLKEFGFRWSPKKQAWYWRAA